MKFSAELKLIFDKQKILRYFLFAGIPATIIYGLSLVLFRSAGFELAEILMDPIEVTGQSAFLGFVAHVGVWLWVASATICFFAAATAELPSLDKQQRELLILLGIFSTILALDDAFTIHSRYISQRVCFFIYAFSAGALFARHFWRIMGINGFSFVFAGFQLGMSVAIDLVQSRIPVEYEYMRVLEEGFKYGGAATLLYFSCMVASFNPSPRHPRR